MNDTFSATVVADGSAPALRIVGRVDRDAEQSLLAAFGEAIDGDARTVILDFGGATYINSSGLAAIVALLTEARVGGITVRARGLTDHYRHLFTITRLTDLVELEAEPGGVA